MYSQLWAILFWGKENSFEIADKLPVTLGICFSHRLKSHEKHQIHCRWLGLSREHFYDLKILPRIFQHEHKHLMVHIWRCHKGIMWGRMIRKSKNLLEMKLDSLIPPPQAPASSLHVTTQMLLGKRKILGWLSHPLWLHGWYPLGALGAWWPHLGQISRLTHANLLVLPAMSQARVLCMGLS
jgi:hypothetical protein